MSDESAVATATPEAPAAPEQVTQVTPATETVAPVERSLSEIRQRVSERGRGIVRPGEPRPERTKPNRAGAPQPINERGEYQPNVEGAASPEPVTPEVPAVGTPPATEAPVLAPALSEAPKPPQQQVVPDGYVRVELPQGHPWRDRGDHRMVPANLESDFRRGMHEAARLRQSDQALQTERLQREAAEARALWWEREGSTVFGPDFEKVYRDLEQAYGKDAAEQYKTGQLSKAHGKLQAVVAHAQTKAVAQGFADNVLVAPRGAPQGTLPWAARTFPGWPEQEVRGALAAYGSYVDHVSQNADEAKARLNLRDFGVYAQSFYRNHPAGQRFAQWQGQQAQKAATDRANAQANEAAQKREQDRLAEASRNRAQNPMGGLNAQTGRSAPNASPDRGLSVQERLAAIKNRARVGTR